VILEAPFDRLLSAARNRFSVMGLPSFPAAELLVFWGGRQTGFDAFTHNPVDYASACRSPALLLAGTGDPEAPVIEARRIFDRLAGAKEFALLETNEHSSLFARDRKGWLKAVTGFLQQRAGDARP
jgi:pimeloyl-ACP methyl ester carboxylesterase